MCLITCLSTHFKVIPSLILQKTSAFVTFICFTMQHNNTFIVFDLFLLPYKVRLDPEKMLIIRNDTQFARFHAKASWSTQRKHSYALPWSCGRGKFSINLSGTGLNFKQTWLVDTSWVSLVQLSRYSSTYFVKCSSSRIECGPSDLLLSINRCSMSK